MINDFLNFCSLSYSRETRCANCPNQCPETGNCEQCLENIHFQRNERTYNCSKILNFYSCKYTHKYASEIAYLFRFRDLSVLPEYRILSLGCGPCTDFLGISDLLVVRNQQTPINYLGIEINRDWEAQHNWIVERNNHNFSIQYQDVYEILENPAIYIHDLNPNVLIVSYLISDLLRNNCNINQFINGLVNNVINALPINSFIIFNDYNRGLTERDPRYHYDAIVLRSRERTQINAFCYHFSHDINNYYRYRNQHNFNQVLFPILPELDRFNPWRFCTSAQLIIQKTL